MTAFLRAALDFGQEAMAGRLDIAVSTLSNKLQPYRHEDRRHYLNFWKADDILGLTGDMRPLELLAARHGFVLAPLHVVPDAPTTDAEMVQDVQTLARFQAARGSGAQVHALNEHIREVCETQSKRETEQEGKP